MRHIQADVIGASEINLDTRHAFVQRTLSRHRNQVWNHSRLATASSKISFNSLRKPGGTFLAVTGTTSGRVVEQYSDPMGRFCAITLLGRLGKRITIISAYQAPKNSGAAGITTVHQQQVLQMKREGITDQNPRRQFCKALDTFLAEKLKAKHQIILGGDFNEDIGTNMHGLTGVISKHNLTDVLQSQLNMDDEPATYARGSKRIDYVFATADVAALVRTCGAEPFNHRFFSDHRGIYVDLVLSGLFDRNLSPLASPQHRDIRSGNPRHIQKYITEIKKQFTKNEIQTRCEYIAENQDDDIAESLDANITSAMLLAGKACAHTSRLPVSPQLHAAQTHHRICQQVVTQFRTNRDMSLQIARKQAQLQEPIQLATSLAAALMNLRSSQHLVRDLARQAYKLKDQFRMEKAEALANTEGIGAQKALERLQRAEDTKEMFRRIPSAKAKPTGGLSLITVPFEGPLRPDETRRGFPVTEPSEVEERLLRRNRKHFSQASPTPFASEPLRTTFNWYGTGETTERILNNNYLHKGTNPEATNTSSHYDISSTADKML
jgi:hypothetical protein